MCVCNLPSVYRNLLRRFHSRRTFDLRGLKTLYVKYDTTENCYQLYLRCLPPVAIVGSGSAAGSAVTPKPKTARKEYIAAFLNLPSLADTLQDKEPLVHEWKLKRITEQCQLQLDAHERTYKMTSNFCYGYASRYNGSLQTSEVSSCKLIQSSSRISIVNHSSWTGQRAVFRSQIGLVPYNDV